MLKAIAAAFIFFVLTVPAAAQQTYWVQIEAKNTLSNAQDRAREYAAQLDGIHGFYLGSGWYGIMIGPFGEAQARTELTRLLAGRAIPSDSYVTDDSGLRQQFWPIGGGISAPPQIEVAPPGPIEPADETPQEARASERDLTREEREELQRAMQWAGFYSAAIDGSFGRGTRNAMQAWQEANNQEPTGILTTKQRIMLLDDYNSVLDGLDIRLVRDDASGIQMRIPTGIVAFTEYQPPFVHFGPTGNVDAQVLFISQTGDPGRMIGLYEVMQTLEIIPPEGPRSFGPTAFEIEGIGNGVHSYTNVTLQNGDIKGFTLVWPEDDNQRRVRVLDIMQSSFERLDGNLDPNIVPPSEDQAIDMMAGLAVRQPKLSRSGFFVSGDGAVITTTDVIDSCERLTLDREVDASVLATDPENGIVLLSPNEPLVPRKVATLRVEVPRLQDRIAVAGYPFDGTLSAPSLTFGTVADIRSLTGDDSIHRLEILPQDGDAGGPVLDNAGHVLGMLLPRADDSNQVLPPEVNYARDTANFVTLLTTNGIDPQISETGEVLSPVVLTRLASDMTVLVSCW